MKGFSYTKDTGKVKSRVQREPLILTVHQAKDYGRLLAQCHGFLSDAQLRAHFELYHGYVKKLNEIEAQLASTSREGANYSFAAYSELRRREPVAYNGTSCTSSTSAILVRQRPRCQPRSGRLRRRPSAPGTTRWPTSRP
jgi:hypothetical protein